MENVPGIWFPKIFDATRHQKVITEIDVHTSLDEATFKLKYASQSVPFILKNHSKHISKADTLTILTSEFGDYKLNVRFGDMSNPDNYLNKKTQEISLLEFVKNHFIKQTNGQTAYAGNIVINNSFLSKLSITFPKYYPQTFFNEPRLWFGRGGTVTQLHKDIPDNFSFVCFGKKRWIIYPPKDFPFLYMTNPNEKELPNFGVSQVNLREIDYRKFPEFAKAQSLEFITDEGDLLYLPAGWSHYVENLEETLMINFWLKREKSPAVLGFDK